MQTRLKTKKHETNPDDEFILRVPRYKFFPEETSSTATEEDDFILRVPIEKFEEKCLNTSSEQDQGYDEDDIFCNFSLKEDYCGESEIKLTLKCYNTLKGTSYLNSNVILSFLKMLQEHFNPSKEVFVVDTHFYEIKLFPHYTGDPERPFSDYKAIQKWAGVKKIYQYKTVIIPIFQDKHWSLIVLSGLNYIANIFKPEESKDYPSVIYLDSLYTEDETILDMFEIYLIYDYAKKNKIFESDTKLAHFINSYGGRIQKYAPKIPKQENSYDCGIYLLTYAELILHDPEKTINKLKEDVLKDWFSVGIISNKRKIIRKLIRNIKRSGQGKAIERYSEVQKNMLNKLN
jgi:Ulp1 family protease